MIRYDFDSTPNPNALPVSMGLSALSFLNQISASEAARVERAIERLSENYETLERTHVMRLPDAKDQKGHRLLSYRAARDVRVFYYVEDKVIYVVDVIRRSQLNSLKALAGSPT